MSLYIVSNPVSAGWQKISRLNELTIQGYTNTVGFKLFQIPR
ncbi:hypothetical protein NIES2135_25850 [Leptolyngbya boryana NIES-2135]|jgi:hypothetical protein|uniref:Uncharacterized protein n=1 Tax=Leptolyngbya boryana NIES-2135 TaxID=1973484 RepID=A0A1Z4JGA7_LEPBY|nr:hypothetical protein NIES2135_25850 [Leptolyngbya boryana NIES-2135]